jgi:hypothetical protein
MKQTNYCMNISKMLVGLCLVMLVGCGTRYSLIIEDPVNQPDSPPKIILGQNAFYGGTYTGLDKEIVDTWRKTGLFKDVIVVADTTPPAEGTFIRTLWRKDYDQNWNMLLGVYSLVTVGMMPSRIERDNAYVTTEFYQNGKLLTTSNSSFTYLIMVNSWVCWLLTSEEKVLREGQVTSAAHIVSRDLAALKKAFP